MKYPDDLGTEAREWLKTQPLGPNGKVILANVINESRRRGYCICPRDMREFINFQGLTCMFCGQPETQESYDFWYKK